MSEHIYMMLCVMTLIQAVIFGIHRKSKYPVFFQTKNIQVRYELSFHYPVAVEKLNHLCNLPYKRHHCNFYFLIFSFAIPDTSELHFSLCIYENTVLFLLNL